MILGRGGTAIGTSADAASLVAGVDEAGRGPLAGPVVAAAVVLAPAGPVVEGLADSKKLGVRRREALACAVRAGAAAWAVAACSVEEIDALNILHATMLAMERAIAALPVEPGCVLIDGNRCPGDLACAARAVVGGDAVEPAISAASILAKTARDGIMLQLDERFPEYGFRQHKGYPTRDHLIALRRHGACSEHRRSFSPVRDANQARSLPFGD